MAKKKVEGLGLDSSSSDAVVVAAIGGNGGGGSGVGGGGSGGGFGGGGGGGGVGGGGGGGGIGGGGGGGGHGPGGAKGALYGDQYVVLRDLDPTDGGGNGEPVLDANGQLILVGTDGNPIYYVQDAEGDYVIPDEDLAFVQTVELGRANVARAPDAVMEKALDSALAKIEAGEVVTADPAGRIVVDGVAIDSPLENLALYKYLMTAGGETSWPEVTEHWPAEFQALLGSDTTNPLWDPSSLLGAAFDKTIPISMDAVLYENSVLDVNTVTQGTNGIEVDYFNFTTSSDTESYNYDRAARYEDVTLQWYENIDADPDLELVTGTVLDAVFDGQQWNDDYITIGSDPNTFETVSADNAGVNDFAQAVDDARAVIQFMHDFDATLLIV